MSEIATQPPPSILAEIRSPEFREQLAAALPPGITPDRFQRVAVTALLEDQAKQRDPAKQLLSCDRLSLYQAVIRCAQDGLFPDGRHAALVKRGDKVAYQPMVAGLRAIAAEYGWTIRGTAVREKDEFDWQEEPPSLYHKVFVGGPRGELAYAYAVARHRDGRREQRVMTRDEVLKRAKSATTDQVWKTWPDEMWAKTPVRDLFQELPLAEAERARLESVLAADPVEELAPGEATAALYGPDPEDPAGADGLSPAEGSQPPAEEPAQDPPSAAPAGSDDEPEPGPEPQPAEVEVPSDEAMGDALEALADAAAGYVPPNGKYASGGENGPKTFAEIAALGEAGAKWFAWALPRISEPPEYAAALWSFCRVRLPGVYQEAAARRDLGEGS